MSRIGSRSSSPGSGCLGAMLGGGRGGRGCSPRLVIALVVVGITLVSYFSMSSKNPVTGESQRIALTVDQEIALGLQAAPEMARQFGGLHPDSRLQELVERIGQRIVSRSKASLGGYQFDFHVLADDRTVNAFALPGGQVFITIALLAKLETDAQVAGVLAHEIGHVVARHGAEHLAKAQLTQGLTGAVVIAASDPESPGGAASAAMVAQAVGALINMKYGRDDELESDRLGLQFMAEAGYDPRAMIRVMEVLQAASGSGGRPEFLSTHPDPGRRIERIGETIAEMFPQGLPDDLEA